MSNRPGAESLPTESDINVYDSLDEQSAVRSFLGKSCDEIEDRCRDGYVMNVTEDLMWMGHRAFAYYAQAVVNYLKGDASVAQPDAVNCFLNLIEFRLDETPPAGPPWPAVLQAVDHVLSHYDKFQVIEDIYGNLRPRYRAVRERLEPLAGVN